MTDVGQVELAAENFRWIQTLPRGRTTEKARTARFSSRRLVAKMYVMRDFQSLVDVGNSKSGGGQQPLLASTNSFRRSLRRANSVYSNRKWVVVSFALPHLQAGVAEKLKRCWRLFRVQ
jgi:hypothetical protein